MVRSRDHKKRKQLAARELVWRLEKTDICRRAKQIKVSKAVLVVKVFQEVVNTLKSLYIHFALIRA